MQYNVAQLLKEPIGSTRAHRLDGDTTADDGSSERVKGYLSLMRTDKGIWVNAPIEAGVWAVCGRCLKRFRLPVNINIEEEYLPKVDITTGQALRVPEWADNCFTIDHKHILNLDEAIRQYTIMKRPMKPLCQEGCLGLCPSCGVDRNVQSCECRAKILDPRWGPLTTLLEAHDS